MKSGVLTQPFLTVVSLSALSTAAMAETRFGNVDFSGLIEIETSQVSHFDNVSSSDVAIASVELGFDADLNRDLSASLVLLHEDEDASFVVDQVLVNYQPAGANWSLTAGQVYLPFGRFESAAISDPLTLALGESSEFIMQLKMSDGAFDSAVFFYNGDDKTNKTSSDKIDNYGVNIGYQFQGAFTVNASLAYLNDMANIDLLQETIAAGSVDNYVSASAFDLMIARGEFSFTVELVRANEAFEDSELSFNGSGAKPSAQRVELGYRMLITGKPVNLGLALQQTSEALALDLPEKRLLLAMSFEVKDKVLLAFELSQDSDYSNSDGGTGESGNAFVVQLAAEY